MLRKQQKVLTFYQFEYSLMKRFSIMCSHESLIIETYRTVGKTMALPCLIHLQQKLIFRAPQQQQFYNIGHNISETTLYFKKIFFCRQWNGTRLLSPAFTTSDIFKWVGHSTFRIFFRAPQAVTIIRYWSQYFETFLLF